MSSAPLTSSIAFRVCLFFARNPDEVLMTRDIADKYAVRRETVTRVLRPAVRRGYLQRSAKWGGYHHEEAVYSAGPALVAA